MTRMSASSFNPFFRLAMLAGGAFVVTVLAITASLFGDPKAPAAQWFDAHAGQIIAVEVAAIVVFSVSAMALDRWHTLRQQSRPQPGANKEAVAPPVEIES